MSSKFTDVVPLFSISDFERVSMGKKRSWIPRLMKRELDRQLKIMGGVTTTIRYAMELQCDLWCYAVDRVFQSLSEIDRKVSFYRKRNRMTTELESLLLQLTQDYMDFVRYVVRENGAAFARELSRALARIDVKRLLEASE